MYLNYVMFVEELAKKASEAAEADGSTMEAYHVQDVAPVHHLLPARSKPNRTLRSPLPPIRLSGSIERVRCLIDLRRALLFVSEQVETKSW